MNGRIAMTHVLHVPAPLLEWFLLLLANDDGFIKATIWIWIVALLGMEDG